MGIHGYYDVVVMGGGPAGLALAVECSRCGLSVVCIDPLIDQAWSNNYALWPEEVTGLDIVIPYRKVWPRTAVWIDEQCQYLIERPYGLIDNIRFKNQLLTLLRQSAGATCKATVRSVSCAGKNNQSCIKSCVVELSDHRRLSAKIVFDVSGQNSIFTRPSTKQQHLSAAQRAVGCWVEERGHPLDPETAILMDFRDSTQGQLSPGGTPTFLYALPINSRQVYLEETSLIRSPGLPFNELQPRLAQRFYRFAVPVPGNLQIKQTHIVMNLSVPECTEGLVAFGAAGGMIHPATGYSVARSLLLAPEVARVLADVLSCSGIGSDHLACLVQQKIWPWQRRWLRHFFMIGAAFLQQLSLNETRCFMGAFFKNTIKTQRAFFAGDMTLSDFLNLAITMLRNLPLVFSLKIFLHFARSLIGKIWFAGLGVKERKCSQERRDTDETV